MKLGNESTRWGVTVKFENGQLTHRKIGVARLQETMRKARKDGIKVKAVPIEPLFILLAQRWADLYSTKILSIEIEDRRK